VGIGDAVHLRQAEAGRQAGKQAGRKWGCGDGVGWGGTGSGICSSTWLWQKQGPERPKRHQRGPHELAGTPGWPAGGGIGGRGAHNGDEDVQARGQGAAVLSKPLHHVGCRAAGYPGAGRGQIIAGSQADAQRRKLSRRAPRPQKPPASIPLCVLTCLLRHNTDDCIGGGGAGCKRGGGVEGNKGGTGAGGGGEAAAARRAGLCRVAGGAACRQLSGPRLQPRGETTLAQAPDRACHPQRKMAFREGVSHLPTAPRPGR
jgi:hypothetical protein